MKFDTVAVVGKCQPVNAEIIATKAAVDTDGRLEFHRTDVKGHTWSCKSYHSPKLCRVAESFLRQDARYGAPSQLSWQLVIPTAGEGVHLALKSDYCSLDL